MITSGTMTFGRTMNLGDYNSKKVEFQLSFSVADGQSVDEVLDQVAAIAWAKTQAALSFTKDTAPSVKTAPTIAKAPVQTEPEPAPSTDAPLAPKKGPGRPPKVTPDKPVDVPQGVIPAVVKLAEESTKPAEVTDAMLMHAVTSTQGRIQNGQLIKLMASRYGVVQPARVVTMAGEKRPFYLEDLEKVSGMSIEDRAAFQKKLEAPAIEAEVF